MIKSIKVTNHLGESITLELGRPEKSGLAITSIEGLGPGKATINTSKISTRDGSLYNSARADNRNIVINVRYLWKDSIEDARQMSYKYFPLKQKVNLVIETANRTVETDGYVESNEPNIFSEASDADISIICPFPFFYSKEEGGVQTTLFSGVDSVFEFPFSNESTSEDLLEMGRIRNLAENVVTYKGDVETGITIYIHALGDAGSITIYNLHTRESMKINADKITEYVGEGIIASDDIVICTEQGSKSASLIRGGTTYNILNCIERDMDWFRLSKGDNVFSYTSDYGSTNLQFQIENRIVYEGV